MANEVSEVLMKFQDPLILIFLLVIPLIVFMRLKRVRAVALKFSALDALRTALPGGRGKLRYLTLVLRCAAIFLIVISLARPVKGISYTRVFSEGIDIILAIDISGSMDARDMTDDLQINRLDAVKEVVEKFISERKNDRIGIIAFGKYSYVQAPLTLDHDVLIDLVKRLKVAQGEEGMRTAIGSAIITCVARLKESRAKSKIVILLTDGRNNYGEIGPKSASEVAKSFKIKIYTIGAGKEGEAPFPARNILGQMVFVPQPLDLDKKTLVDIAEVTGGEFFRARNEKALDNIYARINKMEKVKIEEKKYVDFRDLFPYLLLPAFLLLLVEIAVGNTVLRRLP